MKPLAAACLFVALAATAHAGDDVTVFEAKKDADGVLVHEVRSPFQGKPTQIRVLTPDKLTPGKVYQIIYLLPVEAGREIRFGDSLKEVKKRGLHNTLDVIFVAPTFADLPWYADHPTKADVRQETYFLNVVVPFIEKNYPATAERRGRLLLGFSKSGWGAFSLLLRSPDQFGRAVAWDAPMMMDRPGKYGSGEIFGTAENFENYRIARLLADRAAILQKEKRLALFGYGNFRNEHAKAHELMDALKIDHEFRDGPARAHDWHSGWVEDAAEWLVRGDRPER